ncbi:hypothetical protein OG21DRAFT_1369708, partial [Imleria badia]
LLWDIKSCWDSIYFMINHLHVLNYFFLSPSQCDIADFKLRAIEWLILQDMELVLKISHLAHEAISSKSTPMLGAVVPTFERLITQWKHLAKFIPH